jgi:hypothetical protein
LLQTLVRTLRMRLAHTRIRMARVGHGYIIQHAYSRGLDLPSLIEIGPDVSLPTTGLKPERDLFIQHLRAAQPQALHHVAARIWEAVL